MNETARNLILWAIVILLLLSVFNQFGTQSQETLPITYSEFMSQVERGNVSEVTFEGAQGREIKGVYKDGEKFSTYSPETENTALIVA